MAGSYGHVIEDGGGLRRALDVLESLEARGRGDVYEAIEEMYGMIWWMADLVMRGDQNYLRAADVVDDAVKHYQDGLKLSPTERFGGFPYVYIVRKAIPGTGTPGEIVCIGESMEAARIWIREEISGANNPASTYPQGRTVDWWLDSGNFSITPMPLLKLPSED